VLEAQAAMASQLSSQLGTEQLDATTPMDILSDRLVTQVLTDYFDHHHTVLNTLFCANPKPLPRRLVESER